MSEETNSAKELRFHAQEVVRLTRDLERERQERFQLEKNYERLRYDKNEARRFTAACAALQGILSNSSLNFNPECATKDSILIADSFLTHIREHFDE